MKVIEVEGKTIDNATKKGFAQLGIDDTSRVKVEVVDEGKSGIFGFGISRPAKIRIYYNESAIDIGDNAKEILLNILKKMDIALFLKILY